MTRARFVTLEGGEGVGKSTQAKRLAAALRLLGVKVVETREPGGTAGAEAIRALLMQGEADRWDARAEALLFAAARTDHVARLIAPALERGAWVVCDRYLDSSRAYQGGAGGLSDVDILALHRLGARLMPDRTLLLALPEEQGRARAAARDGDAADRFAKLDADYARRLARRFDEIADAEPERVRRVPAEGSADAVAARVLHEVEDLL